MKQDKEDATAIGITLKNKFAQLFCKHRNKKWFTDYSAKTIKGLVQYEYCTDCGKNCDQRLKEFEGNGFK